MASEILYRKLRAFSENLFSTRRRNKLPATIIGAEYGRIKEVDHSGKVPDSLCGKLQRELLKLGTIGERGIDNILGCCCEVRASNQIILKSPTTDIERIVFTKALRPRTGQTIRRCQNCRSVFG